MVLTPECSNESRHTYFPFLEHLNRIGIRYAILHGWDLLHDDDVSDLDIVVETCDLSRLKVSLHQHYWILSLVQYEATGLAFVLLSKDCDTFSPFKIDVVTDYRWRGRVFLAGRELLIRRQVWQRFWVVGPEEEFAYLLIKKIYEKGTIPERQRTRLQLLASQLGTRTSYVTSKHFGRFYGKQLAKWVLGGDSRRIEARIRQLRNALRRQALKRGLFQPLTYWFEELRRLWGRWCRPTGLSIGIIGAEQQQAETLISLIKTNFSQVFRRVAISPLCFGVGLPRKATTDSGSLRRAGPASIKELFWALHHAAHYFVIIHPLLVRSTLVLLYPFDTDLSKQTSSGKRITSFLERLTCRLIPRPELLFVFDEGTWHCRKHAETSTARSQVSVADEVFCGGIIADSAQWATNNCIFDYLTDRYRAHLHISGTCETLCRR